MGAWGTEEEEEAAAEQGFRFLLLKPLCCPEQLDTGKNL